MSKKEELQEVLKGLANSGDIEGSAIVTRDGLLIASQMPPDVDAETFAAMSATMMGAAETAVSELKKGTLEKIMAESADAKIIATGAGEQAVLVALVKPKANLGLIFLEIKKASKKVEETM